MLIRVMRCPDSEGGGQAAPAAAPAAKSEYSGEEWRVIAAKHGYAVTSLYKRTIGCGEEAPIDLTVERARIMLKDACLFLHQVVTLTSGIVESFTSAQFREIVGPDFALPAGIIRGDNTVSMKQTPPKVEQAPDRDGRKNPRGRKHPLVALIELAAKAAKLLEKITLGLTPEALDREPLAQRQASREAEREMKLDMSVNRMIGS